MNTLQSLYDEDVRRLKNLFAFSEAINKPRVYVGPFVITDNWRESKAMTDRGRDEFRIGATIRVRLPKRWESKP